VKLVKQILSLEYKILIIVLTFIFIFKHFVSYIILIILSFLDVSFELMLSLQIPLI
jgi:hypothetical protein